MPCVQSLATISAQTLFGISNAYTSLEARGVASCIQKHGAGRTGGQQRGIQFKLNAAQDSGWRQGKGMNGANAPFEFQFTSTDGLRIACARWDSCGPSRGIVQIAHGLGEHIGRYLGLIEVLVGAGLVVYGNDHRGTAAPRSPQNASEISERSALSCSWRTWSG